ADAASAEGPTLDVLDVDAPDAALLRHIDLVTRAAIGADERDARIETLSALGLSRPRPASIAPKGARILFVGRPDPYFLAIERAATRAGVDLTAALTSFAAFDHLHDERFDAVLINGASDTGAALSLCGALRRNSELNTLPTLFVTAADGAVAQDAAERGAAVIAAVDQAPTIAFSWLLRAVAFERRRRAVEADLAAIAGAVAEPRSALANPLFAERHVETLARRHHLSGRPLSIAALKLGPAPGATPAHPAVWARAFSEAASITARLVRDADLAAVWDETTLLFTLPALDAAAAETALARIAAVGECTAFATDGAAGPLSFHSSVATLAPGESGAGLLARALAGVSRWAANA
ncbi:MAG: hypothetical protein KJS97_13830, partial [Alphaproteobacteria bacterium]|nr:hypothetical protein [Alphaproteobacteria bacterium]